MMKPGLPFATKVLYVRCMLQMESMDDMAIHTLILELNGLCKAYQLKSFKNS